jgi:protein TonB
MKKNGNKNGAGIFLLLGLISLFFTTNTVNLSAQEIKDDVFVKVEEMPKFKDGDFKSFQTWVMQNVKYPEQAKKEGIEGKVYAEFIVEKDGTVSNVKVIKSSDSCLNEEVIKVVKSSPDWTPGKQNGKIVRVKFVVPVNFALK